MTFEQWRDQMPVARQWAFFDHAAVAPLPAPSARILQHYARDYAENGIAVIEDWVSRVREVRQLAARLVNAVPSDIAFIPSTSMGISIVAEGFPFQSGDNVLSVADEYPSNQYAWMNLAKRGIEFRTVPTREGRVDLDALFAAANDKTRLLTISSVEYATGFRNDLQAIGDFCRRFNIFFFVDAIQSFGAIPFDLQKTPVDAFAADGHKWLLGPEGAGLLYVKREWVERFHTIGVGWNSVVDSLNFAKVDFQLKPHAGRWEGGTANVTGIAAMGESIRLLLEVGIDSVERRIFELTDYLGEKAQSLEWKIFSSRRPHEKSGIVSLFKEEVDPFAIQKRCREARILVNVRGGRLRISPHGYNTIDEIDQLLAVLR